ncbi:hypothetical protein BJ170DRAFT_592549 [Xylariales sp. AK1849]|nr:hypothetical protein BJ170DRAFT_592549 [Xylariales sp. AK1849]
MRGRFVLSQHPTFFIAKHYRQHSGHPTFQSDIFVSEVTTPGPTNSQPKMPLALLHRCGHRLVLDHAIDGVTLKLDSQVTTDSNGNSTGIAANVFCPACTANLDKKCFLPPTFWYSCGHPININERSLELWWELQERKLVPPGRYTMTDLPCVDCEPRNKGFVRPTLRSWLAAVPGKLEMDIVPVGIVELAYIFSIIYQEFPNQPLEVTAERAGQWAKVCALSLPIKLIGQFLDIIGDVFGTRHMLRTGRDLCVGYASKLKRKMDHDGDQIILNRLDHVLDTWRTLRAIVEGVQVLVATNKERLFTDQIVKEALSFPTDWGLLQKASHAFMAAINECDGNEPPVANILDALMVKGCVRLTRLLQEMSKWDSAYPSIFTSVGPMIFKVRRVVLKLVLLNLESVERNGPGVHVPAEANPQVRSVGGQPPAGWI